MRAPIAKIRINAGNPGWYDPLTNIHLTITRPEAIVYEGSNTSNIKKGVSYGLVHVIEGSLVKEEVVTKTKETKPAIKEEVREVAPQVEKTEEIKTVEEVIETPAEVVEELKVEVEEKPKAKKTTTKKKATKKTEDK